MTDSLPHILQREHYRFIAIETAIGACMNGLVPAVAIFLFGHATRIPLFGDDGLFASLIPGTVGPAFGMPIILSLVVRYRVRNGSAPALAWPVDAPAMARLLPRPLILRGLLTTTVATALLPGLGAGLLKLLGVEWLNHAEFIIYNFFHGAVVALLILPLIIIRALSDGH